MAGNSVTPPIPGRHPVSVGGNGLIDRRDFGKDLRVEVWSCCLFAALADVMVLAGVYLRCVFAKAGMVFANPMVGSATVPVADGHAALATLSFTRLSRLLRWGSKLRL